MNMGMKVEPYDPREHVQELEDALKISHHKIENKNKTIDELRTKLLCKNAQVEILVELLTEMNTNG